MAFVVILALAWAAQAFRVFKVEELYGQAASCNGCLSQGMLGSDARFWLVWLLITWAGFVLKKQWIARPLRMVSIITLAWYVLDIYVMTQFNSRMYYSWILLVGANPGAVVEHLAATTRWWSWTMVGAGALALIVLAWKKPAEKPGRPVRISALVTSALCVAAVVLHQPVFYVHGWVVASVFDPRGGGDYAAPYGQETLNLLNEEFSPDPECRASPVPARRSNLMILILESWSPYQSELLSGINDWTPGLDRLMTEHGHYERFMAGGFSTNHGLMSLLAGNPVLTSLIPPSERRIFQPAWGWPETMPLQLGRQGYETAFITNGNLSFTHKGKWLEHIGFEYLEGHNHPFYDGMKRLHFRSAPDGALYDRVIEFLASREDVRPLALVVETVSSHNPFIQPITLERNEEAVFRYLDDTATGFIRSLEGRKYFDEGGLLVVVSDHRAMKAITPEEFNVLGREAHALVPMMILGREVSTAGQAGLFHQGDLAPSLVSLMTGAACGYPGWRDLFEPPGENRCVYNTRGDDRSLVEVYCTRGSGTVRLEGDRSRFEDSTGLDVATRESALREIAHLRVLTEQHNRSYTGRNAE